MPLLALIPLPEIKILDILKGKSMIEDAVKILSEKLSLSAALSALKIANC